MATLSEDDGSWRASGIIRRDFRHTKGDPEIGSGPRRRKNTKRWCKGKVGREHDVRTYTENPHVCQRDCSYLRENGGTGHHPWGMNRSVTKCVKCGMDRWSLHKSYKTNPIQQALADKWCDKGHLYDWMTNIQLARIGLPRYPVSWWGDPNKYEYHACVMCGKHSGKRTRMRLVDDKKNKVL